MSPEEFEDFYCPYCGQTNMLSIDITGGSYQEFVVDCEVCCAPIVIRIKMRGSTIQSLDVDKEND